MAPRTLDYHVLPTSVHKGELVIGHLVSDIKNLMVINDGDGELLTYDESLIKPSHAINTSIETTVARSCSVALLTEAALSVIGGKLQVGHGNDYLDSYFVREMHGLQAKFGESEYLRAVQRSPGAQKYLASIGGYVYMITGLKFCNERSVDIRRGRGLETQAELGVNCGPVMVGPRAQLAGTSTSSLRMTELGDFIFAIKVTKLKYKRKYLMTGKKRLVAKGHYYGAELVGENRNKPVLDGTDDFDVDFEADEEGENEGEALENGPRVKWITT